MKVSKRGIVKLGLLRSIVAATVMSVVITGCGGGSGGAVSSNSFAGNYAGNYVFNDGVSRNLTVDVSSTGAVSARDNALIEPFSGTGTANASSGQLRIQGSFFSESSGMTVTLTFNGQLTRTGVATIGSGTVEASNGSRGTFSINKTS